MPCRLASAAAASSDTAADAMTCTSLRAKRWSSGRGASASGEFRCAMTAAGSFMPYAATKFERFGAAAGIRNGRPRCDERRIVAGNIGDDERHDLCRPGCGRQPSALDRRDMLADRVHRRDRRARREQRLVDRDLVGQASGRPPATAAAPSRRPRSARRPDRRRSGRKPCPAAASTLRAPPRRAPDARLR